MSSPASVGHAISAVEVTPSTDPAYGRRGPCIARKCVIYAGLFVYAIPASAQHPLSTVQLAQRATPATVTILAIDSRGDTVGQGSGFIVTPDGVVVTNYHVMAGAASGAVVLSSGERYTIAAALAVDPVADVAVIKIPGISLPTLPTTNVLPPVGSHVVAVGSPLGLYQTVTDGIVSARRVVKGRELLQISAPISPGSSGGPVLNVSGAVVAISTAYLQGGQALNFAVPVRYAMALLGSDVHPRAIAAVFASTSRTEPSSGPESKADDLMAVAQADSARRMLCSAAYLLNSVRNQMDSLVARVSLAKLTSVSAVSMSAALDVFLPKAELHITRLRLAEVSPPLALARDSVSAILMHVDSLLAGSQRSVDYHRSPSIAALRGTETTTLQVTTLLDREYVRARLAFAGDPTTLPACLDGKQK